jgi:hypothetical protein
MREPLRRVFPNRLQHPVALVAKAQQTLVDERLEDVDGRLADLLGRLERAAASKDREPGEEALLGRREQVV